MSLYLVVHHKNDSRQPWANAWDNPNLIEAITTTREIGERCDKSTEVYIHRCAWGSSPAVICCKAQIDRVTILDDHTYYVSFKNAVRRSDTPPTQPALGQNYYLANSV